MTEQEYIDLFINYDINEFIKLEWIYSNTFLFAKLVDMKNSCGSTALYCAASYGHPVIVKLLLEANASVDTQNRNERTAIYYAICYDYPEIVKLLLEATLYA